MHSIHEYLIQRLGIKMSRDINTIQYNTITFIDNYGVSQLHRFTKCTDTNPSLHSPESTVIST